MRKRQELTGVVEYKRLTDGLRSHSTRDDLTDVQVLQEWRLHATGEDPACEGVCICGKTGQFCGLFFKVTDKEVYRTSVNEHCPTLKKKVLFHTS